MFDFMMVWAVGTLVVFVSVVVIDISFFSRRKPGGHHA